MPGFTPNVPEEWIRLAPPPRPLADGEGYTAFLSYRSVDRPWAVNLYDVLRRFGHTVFLDQCVLVPGQRLATSLEDGLMRSQAGVLVWSSAARDSEWVRDEYAFMHQRSREKPGFGFVPLRLDATPLPPFAAGRFFLDFSAYPDGPAGGELLRLLYALVGMPLSIDGVRFALEQDEQSRIAAAQVETALETGDADRLLELHRDGGLPWRVSAALGCRAAHALLKLNAHGPALEMLDRLIADFPRAIRPKQLKALTLNRRARRAGPAPQADADIRAAQRIAGDLYHLGERDPETLGIYAATWMARYERSNDLADLRQSRDRYAEAFTAAKDDYYVGINAASKSVLLNTPADAARGADLAREVEAIVGTAAVPGDYWRTATAAECRLILGDVEAAAALYRAAVDDAPRLRGEHESTWLQAARLMQALGLSASTRAAVRQAFGHLPDP